MFRLVYLKLKHVYNGISKFYASLIVDHPLATIICYILLLVSFCFGIFQLKVVSDNESLTYPRDSEYKQDVNKISHLFEFNQYERYFQFKLLDLGFYVETIVKLKLDKNSPVNKDILNQYNNLFDEILSIQMEHYDPELNFTDKNITYKNTLCPKRVNKCAIEGSLVRTESFQKKLFNNEIFYEKDDPKTMYIDSELMDGISFDFSFGKTRNQTCVYDKSSDKTNCYLKSFNLIRNRFDLLSNNKREKTLALKFMNEFVSHMDKLAKSNKYDRLDFSYYASHTLEKEIEKYSKIDFDYVLISFFTFWVVYFMFMWFDIKMFKEYLKTKFSLNSNPNCSNRVFFTSWFKAHIFWINNCGFLVLVTCVQFLFTIGSTLGIMSLLSIPVNQILYSIIFILMIINCHQSLMLYKNVSNCKIKNNNSKNKEQNYMNVMNNNNNNQTPDSTKTDDLIDMDDESTQERSLFDLNIEEKLTKAIQIILVPSFCTLTTSFFAYLIIGITTSLDAIRYYCYFLVMSLALNFFGQVAFFCPCLVLHLKRVKENRNCILLCYKYKFSEPKSNNSNRSSIKQENQAQNTPNTNENINNEQLSNLLIKNDDPSSPINTQINNTIITKNNKKNQTSNKNKKYKLIYNLLFNKTDMLFDSKLKYFFLGIFVLYFILNIIFITINLKIDLPLQDLQPSESYLKKHLDNHLNNFYLGPIVMVNFIKPLEYWNKDTYKRIRNYLDDCQNLKGMAKLEISWLEETKIEIEKSKDFYPKECANENSIECFYIGMKNAISLDQNKDDVNFVIFNNSAEITDSNFIINSSRIYIQMESFTGSRKDLILMNSLKDLAEEKHNFTKDDLILFSPVFIYLEQMNEIHPTFISMFLISFECIFFGSLILIFDLRTIFILLIVEISFFLSVLSNMVMLDITLNIVTLLQLVLMPVFLFEFFYHQAYLFLYKSDSECINNQNKLYFTSQNEISTSSSSSSSSISFVDLNPDKLKRKKTCFGLLSKPNKSIEKIKLKRLKFAFNKSSKTSALFFLFIAIFSLNFMYFCDTYNFHILYFTLMSISLNLFLHLSIFYPTMLLLFGPCWVNKRPKRNSKI